MDSEEIKQKIKDIITNHIRSAEDPTAADQIKIDLHDVLTAKMREKVLGRSEEQSQVEIVDDDLNNDLEDNDDDNQE